MRIFWIKECFFVWVRGNYDFLNISVDVLLLRYRRFVEVIVGLVENYFVILLRFKLLKWSIFVIVRKDVLNVELRVGSWNEEMYFFNGVMVIFGIWMFFCRIWIYRRFIFVCFGLLIWCGVGFLRLLRGFWFWFDNR